MSAEMQFFINITAIILGPIVAVVITLGYQRYREKLDAKTRLFLTLMANRKASPPTLAWAEALNLIDVVYSKHADVVQLWHEYYDLLHESSKDYTIRDHKYLELLSSMAKALGYNQLQQIDIDKFYTPNAHGTQKELNYKVQTELLRVLEETSSLKTEPRVIQNKTKEAALT